MQQAIKIAVMIFDLCVEQRIIREERNGENMGSLNASGSNSAGI